MGTVGTGAAPSPVARFTCLEGWTWATFRVCPPGPAAEQLVTALGVVVMMLGPGAGVCAPSIVQAVSGGCPQAPRAAAASLGPEPVGEVVAAEPWAGEV